MACSGSNGTCVSPNNCSCTTGYGGTNCEFFKCFGKFGNDVCSGNGICSHIDSCACNQDYAGTQCDNPICFGSTNPLACSGSNGTCTSPNNCGCTFGHTGNKCEFLICYGKSSNDSTVCNSHGNCQNPDSCVCHEGYTGNQCEIPICNGLTDPLACSGSNGTCSSPGTCICDPNHGGFQCEIPKCFGILGNETNACNSHGNCFSVDSCKCNSQYSGNQCQNPICFGFDSIQTTSVCSGNGTCSSPNKCQCNSGYVGDQCNIFICNGKLSNDSTVCSSHGNCIGKEQCQCNSGYTGSNCELNICNGKASNDASVCSTHGTCTAPNTCNCQSGWTGSDCQTFTCVDRNSCSGQGTCVGANTCNCNSLYTGSNCSFPICYGIGSDSPLVCSGNGRCDAPNSCSCSAGGYSGSFCNVTVCTDVDDCTGHGLCVGANNCSCFAGWQNTNCSKFDCDETNNCSYPQGTCTNANTCNCTSQWSGSNCASPVCFTKSALSSDVCSGNGNCTLPDICQCKTGWTGNNCQNAICNSIVSTNPTVCNSRGSCPQPNNCTCNSGYTGNDCQYTICNGISNQLSTVCSGHGTCNSPDICTCTSQYSGRNCEIPICFGKLGNETNSCTSTIRGTCSTPDNCTCNIGYSGNECQNNICFGIDSTSSTVCSSHGNCTEKDTCTCLPSYYGHNCQFSDLSDFVTAVCTTSCSFNKTGYQTCIDKGPSCYCNKNFEKSKITCDSSFRITGISFTNEGFSGSIPSMLNFTSLESLDLSLNGMKSVTILDSYLPNSLKNLNLSFNQISNDGKFYEVLTNKFQNFNSLSMDGNGGCGIYPSSWLENSFFISTKNHQKSYWCDNLDSSACTNLQLSSKQLVILPHETNFFLNYTTSIVGECKDYLKHLSIKCESGYQNTKKESNHLSSNNIENFIQCQRNGLISDIIDQNIHLSWKYNSSLLEKISTNVHIVNLPFSNISKIDPHLIKIQNSGTIQISIKTNQNITRYRKNEQDKIYCQIKNSTTINFVEAIPITGNETIVNCLLSNDLFIKDSTIQLFEVTKQYSISDEFLISFIDPKLLNPEILLNQNQEILLRNSNGNKLIGYNEYFYSLSNTIFRININCIVSNGNIQSCQKLNLISLFYDIQEMNLQFKDGVSFISEIETIFYTRNGIQNVYPKAMLSNTPTDTFITFNSSTFNSTVQNMKIYCIDESNSANFTGMILNSTTVKCNSITNTSSVSYKFNIVGIVKNFKMIFNQDPVNVYVISKKLKNL